MLAKRQRKHLSQFITLKQLHQQIFDLESQKQMCENQSDERREKINDLTGQIVSIKKVVDDTDKKLEEKSKLLQEIR